MVFEDEIATALELIEENGQALTLRRLTNAAPSDPTKPWQPGTAGSTITTTDYAVTGVILPLDNVSLFTKGLRYVEGTKLGQDSQIVYIAAAGSAVVPRLKDKLIQGSVEWAVSTVDILSPNGEDILYTLLVQR